MSLKTFVASSFSNRLRVREIHDLLRARGLTPTASWCYAETPAGCSSADWFFELPAAEQRAIVARNDSDLSGSHALLLVADERGKESYAEATRALLSHIPVVWTGHRTTSVVRQGVVYEASFEGALRALEAIHRSAARPWPVDDDWAREGAWRIVTTGHADLEVTA